MKRIALAACLLVAAIAAPAATAADVPVTGTINPGSLSIATSATPSFAVTLDGTDKTGHYTVPTTVTDATGSNAGWNLTITSTEFTTGSVTLADDASSITGVTNTCATTCTAATATGAISYPVGIPAGASAPTAVKYFDADVASGAGQFTNTPAVDVAVPANATAGTYTSTLTLAAVSGP
jgi:hypothetical protein